MKNGSAIGPFTIKLVFSDELAWFLREAAVQNEVLCEVDGKRSIKDIIESKGVPHTEAGRISANGRDVDFHYIPQQVQTIHVFHINPPLDVTEPTLLRPSPFPELRFIVDVNVGKLAQLLRVIGINTRYSTHYADREIAEFSEREKRIVLTKDRGLLKRSKVVFGKYIKAIDPYRQLQEVLGFYGLKGPFALFSRCLQCNARLRQVDKETVLDRLEPKTKKYYSRFFMCPVCGKIYWQGTHRYHMEKRLMALGIYSEDA